MDGISCRPIDLSLFFKRVFKKKSMLKIFMILSIWTRLSRSSGSWMSSSWIYNWTKCMQGKIKFINQHKRFTWKLPYIISTFMGAEFGKTWKGWFWTLVNFSFHLELKYMVFASKIVVFSKSEPKEIKKYSEESRKYLDRFLQNLPEKLGLYWPKLYFLGIKLFCFSK